jgi:hypothetical protein
VVRLITSRACAQAACGQRSTNGAVSSSTAAPADVPARIHLEEYCMHYEALDMQTVISSEISPKGFLLEGPDENDNYFVIKCNATKRGGRASTGTGSSFGDSITSFSEDKKEDKKIKHKETERKLELAEMELKLKERQGDKEMELKQKEMDLKQKEMDLKKQQLDLEFERERARAKRDEQFMAFVMKKAGEGE